MPDQTKIVFQGGCELVVSQPMHEVTQALVETMHRRELAGFVSFLRVGKSDVIVNANHVEFLEEVSDDGTQPFVE